MKELDDLEDFLKKHSGKVVPDLGNPEKDTSFWSKETITSKKIKYIVVGDNPGKTEYDGKNDKKEDTPEQGYFIGRTKYIKDFMNKLVNNKNEVLYLNKTPFWSNRINDLKKSKDVEESCQLMAKLVCTIYHENKKDHDCKVWILGYESMQEGENLSKFWERLKEYMKDNMEDVFCFRHPSGNWFCRDFMDAIMESIEPKQAKQYAKRLEDCAKNKSDRKEN